MSARSLRLVVAPVLLAAAGCSIAASSVSLSASVSSSAKIVSSPIESASESSKSSLGTREKAYRNEVRDRTVAYVRSEGETDAFLSELADVAERHGIADFEASQTTWEGVGEGLARANVTGVQLETYKTTLTGADPVRMNWIDTGYARGKR